MQFEIMDIQWTYQVYCGEKESFMDKIDIFYGLETK